MNSSQDLMVILEEKIDYGYELIQHLAPLQEIDGIMKLQRKIRQEVDFLKRVSINFRVLMFTIYSVNIFS